MIAIGMAIGRVIIGMLIRAMQSIGRAASRIRVPHVRRDSRSRKNKQQKKDGRNGYYDQGGGQVELSYKEIQRIMQSAPVRAALQKQAQIIAGEANRIAAAEGLDTYQAVVESGTRPKGRPYSRAISYQGAEFEWGTSKTERRRILGRAADLR